MRTLRPQQSARLCDVGIRSVRYDFASNLAPETLIDKIEQLNADDYMRGILIQLPLPQHLSIF